MTYSVVRTVYYGPDRTMYRGRILEGASFDEARDCITRWCDWDLCFLNGRHGDGAYTDMPLWPARNHCVHITRIAPSLKYCGSFSESQPREIVYEIWEEAEQDKNIKEENIMTNAEMAKQIKEFAEKLDRYYANQEETINKYDDKIVHLHNELEKLAEKVDGLGIVAQETTRQLHEIRNTSEAQTDRLNRYRDVQDGQFANYDANIGHLNERLGRIEHRLDSMSDAGSYVRQVAEESKKIEDALKVTTRKLDLFSQKNAELMERNKRLSEQNVKLQEDVKASNKMCDAVSKKASKLADRVQKLEADSSRTLRLGDLVWQHEAQLGKLAARKDTDKNEWVPYSYCEKDVAVTQTCLKKFMENKKDIIFSEFNAGKRAVVFNGSDHLDEDYLDFCRGFDKWCNKCITEDKMTPWSHWIAREKIMAPLMECSSIYEDHSSFAIWVEHNDEEGEHTFKYSTLRKDWRKHNVIGGLPYTEWSV